MCNALGCSTELVVVHEARKKLNLYRRKFASDISSYHECFLFFLEIIPIKLMVHKIWGVYLNLSL